MNKFKFLGYVDSLVDDVKDIPDHYQLYVKVCALLRSLTKVQMLLKDHLSDHEISHIDVCRNELQEIKEGLEQGNYKTVNEIFNKDIRNN